MKRTSLLVACLTILVPLAANVAFSAQPAEIIVTISAPDQLTALPSGAQYAQLTREDIEFAKAEVKKAYHEAKAQDLEGPIVAQLPGGVFLLTEPIVLGPEDSGDDKRPIIWRGSNTPHKTIFSGGTYLSDWTEVGPGVVQTTLPEVAAGRWHFRTLWDAARELQPVRCRLPKEGYFRIEKSGEDRRTNFVWQDGDLKPYEDLSNVELVFIHDWSITRCPIQSLDPETRTLRVPRQIGSDLDFFRIDGWEPQPRYFLENSIEFLTEPGEWHLDRSSGKLTYRLRQGETADTLVLIAPKLEHVLTVAGTPDAPVRHMCFEHITIGNTGAALENENTYWGIQATWHHEPAQDGSGVVNVPPMRGAVDVAYAEHCRFDDVAVRDVAATGISFGQGTVSCTLKNSLVTNCGGNGVMVGAAHQNDPARGNVIDQCRITAAGQTFFGAVGIWIGFTQETTVSSSTIRDLPYTGISVGWTWNPQPTVARAQKIVDNEIGHCMQVLSDGGGIYTLGFQPDSILSGNHIHHVPLNAGRAESNGMFLDEGTKGFTIADNFIHDTDMSPLRFHRAESNLVKGNYLIVPTTETPMIRYNSTPEENITKVDNVTEVDDLDAAVKAWRSQRDPG